MGEALTLCSNSCLFLVYLPLCLILRGLPLASVQLGSLLMPLNMGNRHENLVPITKRDTCWQPSLSSNPKS